MKKNQKANTATPANINALLQGILGRIGGQAGGLATGPASGKTVNVAAVNAAVANVSAEAPRLGVAVVRVDRGHYGPIAVVDGAVTSFDGYVERIDVLPDGVKAGKAATATAEFTAYCAAGHRRVAINPEAFVQAVKAVKGAKTSWVAKVVVQVNKVWNERSARTGRIHTCAGIAPFAGSVLSLSPAGTTEYKRLDLGLGTGDWARRATPSAGVMSAFGADASAASGRVVITERVWGKKLRVASEAEAQVAADLSVIDKAACGGNTAAVAAMAQAIESLGLDEDTQKEYAESVARRMSRASRDSGFIKR